MVTAGTRSPRRSSSLKASKLNPETRKNAVLRPKSSEGYLEGTLRLLGDENVYCVDVIEQLSAVKGALTEVNDMVLRSPITKDHVSTAILRGDTDRTADEMEALKYKG